MTEFTPISALIGGAFIGLAAVLLMALNGRIAGISGIAGGLLESSSGDRSWRWLFIIGLLAGVVLHELIRPESFALREGYPPLLLVAAGLIVGIGTRMGSGCTSGHGVCGISRFSARSLVATIAFMITAAITVAVVRHGFGVL
ncbi:putative membrane protein YedE/YeeE [Natronospira proteinivora]|uniref:Membrane protein YedE/YeeE n=1 Tax=Natronospira proteinivora TaxID=1807133 RepID=A0ABT1G6V6_9GAMM|nr:YeeE/YedE thiosulfate transporter family protein [Natronospira proteinivora]MCP1727035.1 putative membrane protein YedE/YeeE [Natronospira proteinivora]